MIVKLNTLHMFDEKDHKEPDYPLWEKIAQYMDGELAEVLGSASGNGKFCFLGLCDEEKEKELCYMMEQDSYTGCFIDNREDFEKAWAEGYYQRELLFYLEPENVVFIEDDLMNG